MSLDIAPATEADLGDVLPLFAGYQRFYGAEPDGARNRIFFARFISPSEVGALLQARDAESGEPLGFATLYWTFSSTRADEQVLMKDLFVVDAARGRGVGRALIDAAAATARERGAERLVWSTAPDNLAAQALYDRTGAERSTWLEYELTL